MCSKIKVSIGYFFIEVKFNWLFRSAPCPPRRVATAPRIVSMDRLGEKTGR